MVCPRLRRGVPRAPRLPQPAPAAPLRRRPPAPRGPGLPFCKAMIFWCCCSVKAVSAFKCFKVNSSTTAFSRCPSVCKGKGKGAARLPPATLWPPPNAASATSGKLVPEGRYGQGHCRSRASRQATGRAGRQAARRPAPPPPRGLRSGQAAGACICLYISAPLHLTVNFRCSGSKSFSWAMHSLILSRLFFSISLCGSLYVS